MIVRTLALFIALAAVAGAQAPTGIAYRLTVGAPGTTDIAVEMTVRGAPPTFEIAMVAHPEYDDQYWRYLSDLRGESRGGAVTVTRVDSSLWRVSGSAGEVTLHYRVHLPVAAFGQQEAWKAHLWPTGGLIGGPHSFLYVVGAEREPMTLDVIAPTTWTVVTGLDSTEPRHYVAAGIEQLVDSPILVGPIRRWSFEIAGVPHHVNYLGHPGGAAFDTAAFVRGIERIAQETERMFGAMPYRRYEFLFEDGTFGGLEHTNSVSLGASSTTLARDANAYFPQVAHEFFHTWNEVHLRPRSWISVRHVAPEPNGELWWSEGVTLFYADLIQRRAGFVLPDSSRVAHLERLLGTYLSNPSHGAVSPEETSRAFNRSPVLTGDYSPSMYTQGEVIGNVLDLMIRSGSGGQRSLDDAMRAMTRRFNMAHGFVGADIDRAVAEACSCDTRSFFDNYVRAAHPIDFDPWLATLGLRMTVTRTPALGSDGTPSPDLRMVPISGPDSSILLKVALPGSVWGRAGLHTGDRVESIDGQRIAAATAFRAAMGRLHVGDSLHIVVTRGAERVEKTVVVTGYDRAMVHIEQLPDATPAQRALFAAWSAGR